MASPTVYIGGNVDNLEPPVVPENDMARVEEVDTDSLLFGEDWLAYVDSLPGAIINRTVKEIKSRINDPNW